MAKAKSALKSAVIAGAATALLGAGIYGFAPDESQHFIDEASHAVRHPIATVEGLVGDDSNDADSSTSYASGHIQVPSSSDDTPMPDGGQAGKLSRNCPKDTRLPTADSLQHGLLQLSQTPKARWTWADGGVSTPLGDSRVLWLFGDTLGDSAPGKTFMVGNSMLISSGSCFASVSVDGDPAVLPHREASANVQSAITWPTSVIVKHHQSWDEVQVIGVRVHRLGGFWGFSLLGSSVTRFAIPHGGAPQRLGEVELTADDASDGHITWGAATLQDGNMLYLYGTARMGGEFGRRLYVAKMNVNDLANQKRWTYWNGAGWGSVDQLAPSLRAGSGVSQTVSVFRRNGAYYLVSKIGGDLGKEVGLWRSTSPAGPWTIAKTQYRPYSLGDEKMQYLPLAHPEISSGNDIMISMSRNSSRKGATNKLLPEFFTMPIK